MLTLLDRHSTRFCDGLSRRSFLRIGGLGFGSGVCGVSLPQILQAATGRQSAKAKSVVMVYLPGGPTQHETFDPKPTMPSEIRGAFRPTATRVPGVHFCELLPKLSANVDKFSVVRTLTGMQNRHESFQCYTGRPGGRSGDNEPASGWPSLGSVVSKTLGPSRPAVPPYVDAATSMGYGPYNNTGAHDPPGPVSWPGFTGSQHVPFALAGNIKTDLTLHGIDLRRLDDRRLLLDEIRGQVARNEPTRHDEFAHYQQQAFGMLTSNAVAEAIDLDREDPKTRQRYGKAQPTDSSFGGAPQDPQRLLLARRLVEAGVRCVTVAFGAWDWHANREGPIDQLSKKYLPIFDHALTVFLCDLQERGLLDEVAVVVWGEFGRTPRINAKGGRDHWPSTQSVVLAGGGIQGGRVIGQTDHQGGVPIDRPIHVQEVFATLYDCLGIDVGTTTVTDLNGRPHYLVDAGRAAIRELL